MEDTPITIDLLKHAKNSLNPMFTRYFAYVNGSPWKMQSGIDIPHSICLLSKALLIQMCLKSKSNIG